MKPDQNLDLDLPSSARLSHAEENVREYNHQNIDQWLSIGQHDTAPNNRILLEEKLEEV